MKKLLLFALAVVGVCVFPATLVLGVNQVDVTTTSEPLFQQEPFQMGGGIQFTFDAGSVISEGYWWIFDLPLGATLARKIDFEIVCGAVMNPFATHVVTDSATANYGHVRIHDLGGNGVANGTTDVGGGVYFRVTGNPGTQRVTITPIGAAGAALVVEPDTEFIIDCFDGNLYPGWGFEDDNSDGIYDNALEKNDNEIHLDVRSMPGAFVNVSFDSNGGFFTFLGDTEISHVVASTPVQMYDGLTSMAAPVAADAASYTLPYFPAANDPAWWSGLTINNGATAGNATLDWYEADGDKGTATVAVPAYGKNTWVLNDPSFLALFTPDPANLGMLGDADSFITVNPPLFSTGTGYAMMGDGSQGFGIRSTPPAGSFVFPYLPDPSGLWWSDLAVCNPTAVAGDASISVYEQDGDQGTATIPIAAFGLYHAAYAALLPVLAPDPGNPGDLGDSPSFVAVTCVGFTGNGVAFYGNGAEGCASSTTQDSVAFSFPFFPPANDPAWWGGLAVSNNSAAAGNATLTLYERDGDTGKAVLGINARGTWLSTLNAILPAFVPDPGNPGMLGDDYSFVSVATTFPGNGHGMLGNGIQLAEAPPTIDATSFLIPYYPAASSNWGSIVSIFNNEDGSGTASLTLYEEDGDKGYLSGFPVPGRGLFARRLEDLVPMLTPDLGNPGGLGDAKGFVAVSTTFNASGYGMIVDTSCSLRVTVSPAGGGSINGPGGACAADCTWTVTFGSTANLTASASAEYAFDRWQVDLAGSANPATLVMNGNKMVTAVFRRLPPPNRPPVLAPVGNQTVEEGELLTFDLSATDDDGDPLTFSAAGLPAGATLAGSTFSWQPDYGQMGSCSVTFTVSDGTATASETITISVEKGNRPPVLGPLGNRTVQQGALITFSVSGSDPEGDPLTCSADNLPAGASFSGRTFSWTPGYSQVGTFAITFTVSDGEKTASGTMTITVIKVNMPPGFLPIETQRVHEEELLTLIVNAVDPNDDRLTYTVGVLPQGAEFDPLTREFSWKPSLGQSGTYRVEFAASDGILSDTVVVTIEVAETLPGPPDPFPYEEVSPGQGTAGVNPQSPCFSWPEGGFAQEYDLVIAKDRDFHEVVLEVHDLTEARYCPGGRGPRTPAALDPCACYFWKVCACNLNGDVDYPVFAFATANVPSQGGNPPPMVRLTCPEPTPGMAYQLISVPLQPENANAVAVLGDDLGPYTRCNWRLFRYDSLVGELVEYPNIGPMEPGLGYWLVTKYPVQFDAVGTPVDTQSEFTVQVPPGFFQLGHPFFFPVNWSEVKVRKGEVTAGVHDAANVWLGPVLQRYENEEYRSAEVLEPWKGYWVQNISPETVELLIPPKMAVNSSQQRGARQMP